MRIGLRARVSLAFAMVSLIVAGVVAGGSYFFARWYLLDQREAAALTRAVLDSRSVDAAIGGGQSPASAIRQVPSVGTSQPMLRSGDAWFTASVTVPPDALPQTLLATAQDFGARQRVEIAGEPYFVVAIPVESGTYVEVFPLRDLDRTFTLGGLALVAFTALAAAVGAAVGAATAGRVLVPLRQLARGAQDIAGGQLSTRIPRRGDPDLDSIADSFNEMAEAVERRIARERRFTANVSHELRSPLTAIQGSAELLESHRDRLPEADGRMVTVLGQQVRRLSRMLLDLLEISKLNESDPLQWESVSVSALCRESAGQRGLDPGLVLGDDAVVQTDARRLERIIGNLIDNGERHGKGVTRIQVRREPGEVHVIVDDAGSGILPEERERVFEPFARGDNATGVEGAGLGLAIVAEQAALIGADIRIDDAAGGGARFTVVLPDRPDAS